VTGLRSHTCFYDKSSRILASLEVPRELEARRPLVQISQKRFLVVQIFVPLVISRWRIASPTISDVGDMNGCLPGGRETGDVKEAWVMRELKSVQMRSVPLFCKFWHFGDECDACKQHEQRD